MRLFMVFTILGIMVASGSAMIMLMLYMLGLIGQS